MGPSQGKSKRHEDGSVATDSIKHRSKTTGEASRTEGRETSDGSEGSDKFDQARNDLLRAIDHRLEMRKSYRHSDYWFRLG